MLDIINDILEMSKIESGSCDLCEERFDLTKLLLSIEQMLGMKAESKGLYLKFDRQADVPQWVVSDKGKLRQILVNLLGNALKFTMEGGITVNIKRLADPMLDGGRFRLRFEIIDTGTGIAEEEIPLLFERFAQTESGRKSHQGTGLGLPITKTFVELMGGEIKVRSKQGEGTEFDFEIIAEKSHADPEEEVPIVENRPVSGIASDQDTVRILIAEDQPANRLLLSTLLRKAGFEVDEAENGQMAVDLWRKTEPDIIFMDQEMPIMDGNEATRAITAACQSEPLRKKSAIISLTANALEDSRKAALDAGCIDFISKPFKHEDLFEIIAKHANVRYDYAEV